LARRPASDVTGTALFADLFGTEEMRAVFSDGSLIQSWLDAEAALAWAEAEVGLVPPAAAAEIDRRARADLLDVERLRAGIRETTHPLVAVVWALAELCEGDAGGWVHWGATTQDIMDTGTVLQARRAHSLLAARIGALLSVLAQRTREERDTPMAGRTHGQHAVPTTLGLKLAVFLEELLRHRDRLDELAPRLLVGQLGGAAGTLASLGEHGPAVRRAFCARLGLAEPRTAWHTARDGLAEFAHVASMAAATCERLAGEVILLQKTEVGELAEVHEDGNVGSSTMPQKRNPMRAEGIVAASRLARRGLLVALEGMVGQHERDMGAWQAEWEWLPDVCAHADAAVAETVELVRTLTVDRARMRTKLGMTGGLIMSEAVMMALAPRLGRQRAHEVVHAVAMGAYAARTSFVDALLASRHVGLDAAAVDELLDPTRYLGLASIDVDEVLAAYEERA
jgi:3-carboxy-cis,cis-muconate cycloisomerase